MPRDLSGSGMPVGGGHLQKTLRNQVEIQAVNVPLAAGISGENRTDPDRFPIESQLSGASRQVRDEQSTAAHIGLWQNFQANLNDRRTLQDSAAVDAARMSQSTGE